MKLARHIVLVSLSLVLAVTLLACSKSNDYVILSPKELKPTVLTLCSREKILYQSAWQPSKEDILRLEKNLISLSDLESDVCCNQGKIVGSPFDYYRQYIGLVIDSQKYIYINASSKEHSKLHKDFGWACDGGKLFWGVFYNPAENKFSHLEFNGYFIK